jgi:hypothetical protein
MADSLGNVLITISGTQSNLRCSLAAAKSVNARFGSFTDALRRVAAHDLSAITYIVAAGLGKCDDIEDIEKVEAKVYETGSRSFIDPVTRYIALLANGGRLPAKKDGAKEGTEQGEG